MQTDATGESTTADQLTYRGRYRIGKVPPCLITQNDLRRLYTQLDARASEALEKHVDSLTRPPGMEEQTWSQTLEHLRQNAFNCQRAESRR
jgi:hypothetical protein